MQIHLVSTEANVKIFLPGLGVFVPMDSLEDFVIRVSKCKCCNLNINVMLFFMRVLIITQVFPAVLA